MTKEQRIIRKAIDELETVEPKLDYVRGMLEGLVEDEPIVTSGTLNILVGDKTKLAEVFAPEGEVDEVAILDAQARKALETVKELSDA